MFCDAFFTREFVSTLFPNEVADSFSHFFFLPPHSFSSTQLDFSKLSNLRLYKEVKYSSSKTFRSQEFYSAFDKFITLVIFPIFLSESFIMVSIIQLFLVVITIIPVLIIVKMIDRSMLSNICNVTFHILHIVVVVVFFLTIVP